MVGRCRECAYEKADCKGNKDLEKIKCEYFKKPQVFNAKEAAERIAELEEENKMLRKAIKDMTGEYISLMQSVAEILERR